MTDRRIFTPFKNSPYVGLFQYPLLPSCARRTVKSSGYILPLHNPYIGYFNNTFKPGMFVVEAKHHKHTQTDPDPAMVIGQKIIESYGEDYVVVHHN